MRSRVLLNDKHAVSQRKRIKDLPLPRKPSRLTVFIHARRREKINFARIENVCTPADLSLRRIFTAPAEPKNAPSEIYPTDLIRFPK